MKLRSACRSFSAFFLFPIPSPHPSLSPAPFFSSRRERSVGNALSQSFLALACQLARFSRSTCLDHETPNLFSSFFSPFVRSPPFRHFYEFIATHHTDFAFLFFVFSFFFHVQRVEDLRTLWPRCASKREREREKMERPDLEFATCNPAVLGQVLPWSMSRVQIQWYCGLLPSASLSFSLFLFRSADLRRPLIVTEDFPRVLRGRERIEERFGVGMSRRLEFKLLDLASCTSRFEKFEFRTFENCDNSLSKLDSSQLLHISDRACSDRRN